jgi:hypothetical protein
MCLYLLYVRGIPVACGLFVAFFFIYYGIFIHKVSIKYNKHVPLKYKLLTIFLVLCISLSALIAALLLDSFNDFLGFSITYLFFTFIFLALSIRMIYKDLSMSDEEPFYFSPWIFPIYKFNKKEGTLIKRSLPFMIFLFGNLLLLIWTVIATIWIDPNYLGVSLSCIVECILYISLITLSSWS